MACHPKADRPEPAGRQQLQQKTARPCPVEALREHVRSELRGSKTPDTIVVRDSLPHTDTGKMLRRVVLTELTAES